MDVRWNTMGSKIASVESVDTDVKTILDLPWDKKSYKVFVPTALDTIELDLRKITSPLGDFWKTLHSEGDFGPIKDALQKYWQYKGKPALYSEFLVMEGGDSQRILIRSKVALSDKSREKALDLNRLIHDANESVDYDKVVVGSDDSNLELQLLNTRHRTEIKAGDAVDCGLFININGGIKVAAGVNRLVCTNGLTRRVYAWKGHDYKFGKEFIAKAMELANWMAEQGNIKVHGARELGVSLRDYPKPMLNRFWKSWTERIDLKELTWQDVINDLTQSVNTTLSGVRYKVLQTPVVLDAYRAEHRCPTCSAHVE